MAQNYALTSELEIVIEECIECGAKFGITKTMHTFKKNNKKTFYCPNGHAQSYTKSEAERLMEIIAQKDRSLEFLRKQESDRIAAQQKKYDDRRKKRDAKKKIK